MKEQDRGSADQVRRGRVLIERSVAAMLDNQHASGAFVASSDFAQYQFCWLRDGAFIAYALDCAGETLAAERFHAWCATAIDRIGSVMLDAVERRLAGKPVAASQVPPARFSLDGLVVNDDWPAFQVDGYGTWLWALHQHMLKAGNKGLPSVLAPAVRRTALYLAEVGTSPCFDVWEEAGGSVHTGTLGCVYAGLRSAADMLADPRLAERAGSLHASILDKARRDGWFCKSDHSAEVDAALLWLCAPLQVVAPREPAFVETARRIATELDLAGGTRRYAADSYYGGGAWPLLTASLGLYYATVDDLQAAERRRAWVAERFDDLGRLPEQFGGDERDPEHYCEWVERWGPPAADLTWSHAMYVILALELERRTAFSGAG
jgi:GH15 family glucan-1,4-alpha-glucosidase